MTQDESFCQVSVSQNDGLLYLTFHFVTVALDYAQVCLLVDQLTRLGAKIAPTTAEKS
jgi:hypothetical protein